MTDKMNPVPMEPISVNVIGGTGDGKPMTLSTPAGQPDVIINPITTFAALLTRFVDTFLTIVVAAVGAATTTGIIPYSDFKDLVIKTSSLALVGSIIGLAKDLLVVVGKLKKKFPLLDV